MTSNRSISVEIKKKYLVEYLRWVFKAKISGPIEIDLRHPIGKHIYSMVFNVPYKLKRKSKPSDIELLLPQTRFSNYDSHFIHIYRWGEEKINCFVDSWFHMEFNRHMNISERLGIEFRHAVDNFMFGRKICMTNIDRGSLIKNDWRFRNNIQDIYNTEKQPEFKMFIQD